MTSPLELMMGWRSVTNAHIERAGREPLVRNQAECHRGEGKINRPSLATPFLLLRGFPADREGVAGKASRATGVGCAGVFRPCDRDDIDIDDFFREPPRAAER